jgi:hypothetical protein
MIALKKTPMKPLKQTSAEPLACSVRQMKVVSNRVGDRRSGVRAAASRRGDSSDRFLEQRRDLERRAWPLRKLRLRCLLGPSIRVARPRSSLVATVRLRAPSEPNKAPEPTTTAVTSPAVAGDATAAVVAHL